MATIWGDYTYVFDDVSFGIAVKEARMAKEMTQEQLAAILGHTSGHTISRLEVATYQNSITLRDYLILCNFLSIPPTAFWDTHPSE